MDSRDQHVSERRAALLETILHGVADGVIVRDRSGELVYGNAAAAEILGYDSVESLLAGPVSGVVARAEVMDEQGRRLGAGELPGALALNGKESPERILRLRHPVPGEERWILAKARPRRGDDGEVELAIIILEEITAQKRAERAQAFLAESSRVLGGSLDYSKTLVELARLGAAEVADWCSVDVLDRNGALTPVAVAHDDETLVEAMVRLRAENPLDADSSEGIPAVIRSASSQLAHDPGPEAIGWRGLDDEERAAFEAIGLRSLMIAPMIADGEALGTIAFASGPRGRRFDDDDLALAEEVARRAGMAILHSRLYRERSRIASTLQESLLPPALPDIPGLDLAARFRAQGPGHEVGGDFYDVFAFRPGGWAIVMGDVGGKGARAAATTALARYTMRAAALPESKPSEVLDVLNSALLRDDTETATCTAVVAFVDVGAESTQVELASAGHPLPVRLGESVTEVGAPGMLLGAFEDCSFTDTQVELASGETLVLYTDGVTDAHAPANPLSTAEFHASLDSWSGMNADEIVGLVEAEAVARGTQEPRDDIAVIALRARTRRFRSATSGPGRRLAGPVG